MPFFLDEQTSAALEQPLRANYSTRTERSHLFRRRQILPHILFDTAMWQGYRIHGPDSQGRAAVKAGIEELERRCIRWVSSHLPGVFSSHVLGQDFPTAVLLVTEVATPATAEARAVRAFSGLSVDRDYDAWESAEWPCGRLVFPRSWEEEGRRLTFGCRRHDAFPAEPGYAEPESNLTLAFRADDLVRGLLSAGA